MFLDLLGDNEVIHKASHTTTYQQRRDDGSSMQLSMIKPMALICVTFSEEHAYYRLVFVKAGCVYDVPKAAEGLRLRSMLLKVER